ncbi:MAG TPA: hypothetical protein VLS89_12065, partial [Candidatus Nanopelagicales bacterium]|nr:hypothetical protein [Candidatus Nanopelagicales bacterium]
RGPARPTLFAGMPANSDRYPGALPLYARRALQAPGGDEEDEGAAAADQGRDCAYFVRMAALYPPAVEVAVPAGVLRAEPRRLPDPRRLERASALLVGGEALAREGELADRLMGWACLAAVGESAALDMALAGQRRLAGAAVARATEARAAAREALAKVRWGEEEGEQIRKRLSAEFGGRTWLLLFLHGGERVVLDLVDRGRRDDWGQVSALAALILWGPTAQRGSGGRRRSRRGSRSR